jgi:hypothetical protein
MSRAALDLRLSSMNPPRSGGGIARVARLFLPGNEAGILIRVPARPSRNSDARRRLARLVESRRVVS